MTRHAWGLLIVLAACQGGGDEPVDTDGVDTDTDAIPADTDVDTGETGSDTPIGDTEVPDTDGEHVVVHGRMRCAAAEDPDAKPAAPATVKITLVQPWTCVPIGPCSENTNVEVLAETTVDKDGKFDLDFQTGSYLSSELFLYTKADDRVCGNGYQYTQERLADYADWSDIVIDVYSIWY